MARLRLWTDGCCLSEPGGRGGWAFVVERSGRVLHLDAGNTQETRAERMELAAVLQALVFDVGRSAVEVVTDSEYVFHYATNGRKGMPAWKRNADLWEELARLRSGRMVRFAWVKGHRHEFNMQADQAARAAARELRSRHPFRHLAPRV